MNYKIIEAICIFENDRLIKVTVKYMVNDNTIHEACSTKSVINGYYYLNKDDEPTMPLFKKIAAYGIRQ